MGVIHARVRGFAGSGLCIRDERPRLRPDAGRRKPKPFEYRRHHVSSTRDPSSADPRRAYDQQQYHSAIRLAWYGGPDAQHGGPDAQHGGDLDAQHGDPERCRARQQYRGAGAVHGRQSNP